MKKFIFLLFIIYTSTQAKELKRQQVMMGTFASITLEHKDAIQINSGFKLLKSVEHALSSYDKNALLYQLNQKKQIEANPYLLEAIQKSQEFYQKSNGYFDISIGSITKKLYQFGENERVPSQKALQKAITNINAIHIEKNIISLDENSTLDLGGMGKGFGVDKVANYYREQNISHGIIALSGDIQALHPTEIYIDSPFKESSFVKLETVQTNTSISTSGTYRRYVKSKQHHHLINPKSKKQGKSFVSITLITKQNNALIDAMATAIGVMPVQEALHFLLNNQEIGYILVRPNGNILYGNLGEFVEVEWL